MIYEWYRGADTSNTVPRRLNDLRQHEEAMSCTEKIKVFRELLEIEKEPNWRGYLLWRIGRNYLSGDCHQEAIAAFLDAKKEFDPLLGTFTGVVAEYCDSLYYLLLDCSQREDIEMVAELALTITANLDDSRCDEFEKAFVFSQQGYALNMLAKRHSLDALRPLALASYLKWHHLEPEDPSCLEGLAYAYFNAGDMARCRSAVEMCLEVAPAGEVRDRVEEFAQEHARELDPASGAS